MSTEAVDLPIDSPQAAAVRHRLAAHIPRIVAIAATPTRIVGTTAGYDGDNFVMAGGLVGADILTCMTGPAWALPAQLGELLSALGEAASVPLSALFGEHPVSVPDALVLADDVRAGAADDLAVALQVAELDQVPRWLKDLAHGVSATFLVLITDAHSTRIGTLLLGLPTGWGHLEEIDGELSMRPMGADSLLTELEEIGLLAAATAAGSR